MGQDGDRDITATTRGGVHVDGIVARGEQAEQRRCQPLGDVALGMARKARPGIDGHLIERRFEVEPHWHTVLGLEGQRVLDQHTNDAASEGVWWHLCTGTTEDLNATDLVPMDRGAQVQPRSRGSPVDQQQRERNPGAICQLCDFERMSDDTPGMNCQACNVHLLCHGHMLLSLREQPTDPHLFSGIFHSDACGQPSTDTASARRVWYSTTRGGFPHSLWWLAPCGYRIA